jgi:hypothetical protein
MKHIIQKLQEAEFFLNGMKHYNKELLSGARFGDSVFTPQRYPLVRGFQYHFSGMLSAWQCAAYYISAKCRRNHEAKNWYNVQKDRMLLAAFKYLRDSDIHDETISPAMRYSVDMVEQRTEQDFVIAAEALRVLPRFKRKQQYVDILTATPILELAETALRELRNAVSDGAAKGYLASTPAMDVPRTAEAALQLMRDQLEGFAVGGPGPGDVLLSFRRRDRHVRVRPGIDGYALLISHHIGTNLPEVGGCDTGYDSLALFLETINEIRKFLTES